MGFGLKVYRFEGVKVFWLWGFEKKINKITADLRAAYYLWG
jgi:hypothetical protein